MKFSPLLLSTALAAVPAAAPLDVLVVTSPGGPDPSKVWISGITTGGTGCPDGTVSQVFSDDRSTFTLIFDTYIASLGPGVPITESRKNCQLNINLHYPGGFQYR